MTFSGICNKEDLVAIALMSEIPDWGSKTKNGIILGAAKQLIPFVLVPVALTQSAPAMVIVDANHGVSKKLVRCTFNAPLIAGNCKFSPSLLLV